MTPLIMNGKVKWFSVDRGYGFIEPTDGSKDVYVHWEAIPGLGEDEGLRDGEEVEFDVQTTPKGLSASNVKRVARESLL